MQHRLHDERTARLPTCVRQPKFHNCM
jgi:hypothetical protein